VTVDQFRGSTYWKTARRIALSRATVCAICGGSFVTSRGHRFRLYPTVDHIRPLAELDLRTSAGLAAAVDQQNLRVVHGCCNARRGGLLADRRRRQAAADAAREQQRPAPSRDW
jgi:5-methylcytosine-specific restriction endonuclease McrA